MKLVNPVGRDLTELETEAYSCHCVCSSGVVDAKMRGFSDPDEGCECDWREYDNNLNEAGIIYGIRKNK
ncbi:CA_C0660 family putative sactipeptide bacteriocin [Clostridium felsineum]|uniref:CA_C0660 family putative sactipeptide bacteriocin n=1 Tax=Clostridium felsineum TaxID=36839 RepID=UPI00098BF16C|nr:CA_C0660 family putative sactipeptide bacteriocin [Clostridium felsineum]URZ17658.1 hypothetical protein CLFE_037120 [Clostridium felsineum DSM 794]